MKITKAFLHNGGWAIVFMILFGALIMCCSCSPKTFYVSNGHKVHTHANRGVAHAKLPKPVLWLGYTLTGSPAPCAGLGGPQVWFKYRKTQ